MKNWQRSLLKDVVRTWIKGATPKRSKEDYFSESAGIPWVRVSDMNQVVITETSQYLTAEGAREVGRLIPKNAVLLSVSGTIGKTAMAGTDLMANQAVQAMVFDEEQVLSEYAYYYFRFSRFRLEAMANTVTIPNLTKTQLENMPILYPEPEEQRAIVTLLKQAENIVNRQRKTLLDLNRILIYVMHEKWSGAWNKLPAVALKEVLTEPLAAGISAMKEGDVPAHYVNETVPGLWGLTEREQYPTVNVSYEEVYRYRLKPGDILMRRYRTEKEETGILAEAELPVAVWGMQLICIRVNPDRIRPEFLLLWMQYSFRYMGNGLYSEKGLADTGAISRMQIPLVPLEEQDALAEIIRKALPMQRRIKRLEETAGKYEQAMLSAAFTGRLTEGYRKRYGLENPEPHFFQEAYHVRFVERQEAGESEKTDWMRLLNAGEQELLVHLSEFQREVLRIYGESAEALPVHIMFKRLQKSGRRGLGSYSIQDSIAAVKILEGLGFLMKSVPEKIIINDMEMTDSADNPLTIQKYEFSGEQEEDE